MDSTEAAPALPTGPFAGQSAFAQCIRCALEQAAAQGWKEMVWSDASFEDWPLYEKATVDSLNAWARPGRKLVLLARHFQAMRQVHHRFVHWRVRWDGLVECRRLAGAADAAMESALWSPHWFLHRTDTAQSRGYCSLAAPERQRMRERLAELQRQGMPAFPSTILGL